MRKYARAVATHEKNCETLSLGNYTGMSLLFVLGRLSEKRVLSKEKKSWRKECACVFEAKKKRFIVRVYSLHKSTLLKARNFLAGCGIMTKKIMEAISFLFFSLSVYFLQLSLSSILFLANIFHIFHS